MHWLQQLRLFSCYLDNFYCFLNFIFSINALAQLEMNYDLLNYMATKEADPDPNDRDGIQKQFRTYFIKEVFLNQVFKSDHLFYSDDQGPGL